VSDDTVNHREGMDETWGGSPQEWQSLMIKVKQADPVLYSDFEEVCRTNRPDRNKGVGLGAVLCEFARAHFSDYMQRVELVDIDGKTIDRQGQNPENKEIMLAPMGSNPKGVPLNVAKETPSTAEVGGQTFTRRQILGMIRLCGHENWTDEEGN